VYEILERVISHHNKTIIFDADGINAVFKNIDILNRIDVQKILTPHPGEMARLYTASVSSKVTVENIQNDRINIASDFAKKYKCVLVLKGASTVIAEGNGNIYINPTGNPGMAKGGSGDILAGMIASYAAQGINPIDAACLGVYLHGLAGDIAKSRLSESGMLPSDLLDILPEIQSHDFINTNT
jgi:NAD(P)H-hydrate epimerase